MQMRCRSEDPVKWEFMGGELPLDTLKGHQPGSKHYWVNILSVTLAHQGTYTCLGYDEHGFYFEDDGVLLVHGE